jgi:hypothetical protein
MQVTDPVVFKTMAGTTIVEGEVIPPRDKWQWRRSGRTSLILTVPTTPLPTPRQTRATTAQIDVEDPWKSFQL